MENELTAESSIPLNGELFAGRYRPVRLLGKGGMGDVYLVVDTMLENEEVALKLLKKDYIQNEKHVSRFLREVKLARQVTHPSVVRTFDVGEAQGVFYLTMEYVVGESLKDLIKRQGPIHYQDVCKVVIQLCEGLAEIHKLNIVHRDLKPANILLSDGFRVKITDFGIARPTNSDLTHADEIVGSTHYLAPEIWLGKELSSATDVYALGVMMYEMLTGMPPFDAENPAELMWKHLDATPTKPSMIEETIPPWLDELVLALMSKDQDTRPYNVQEISDFISHSLAEEEIRFTGDFLAPTPEPVNQSSELNSGEIQENLLQNLPTVDSPKQDLIAQRTTSLDGFTPPSLDLPSRGEEDFKVDNTDTPKTPYGEFCITTLLPRTAIGILASFVSLGFAWLLFPQLIQVVAVAVLEISGSQMVSQSIRGFGMVMFLSMTAATAVLLVSVGTLRAKDAMTDYLQHAAIFGGLLLVVWAMFFVSVRPIGLRPFTIHAFQDLLAIASLYLLPSFTRMTNNQFVFGFSTLLGILLTSYSLTYLILRNSCSELRLSRSRVCFYSAIMILTANFPPLIFTALGAEGLFAGIFSGSFVVMNTLIEVSPSALVALLSALLSTLYITIFLSGRGSAAAPIPDPAGIRSQSRRTGTF